VPISSAELINENHCRSGVGLESHHRGMFKEIRKHYLQARRNTFSKGQYSEALVELKAPIRANPRLTDAHYRPAVAPLGQLGVAEWSLCRIEPQSVPIGRFDEPYYNQYSALLKAIT
jgi:hypothetical protein